MAPGQNASATYHNTRNIGCTNALRPVTGGQPSLGDNHAPQNYQMRRMLLQQQKQERLIVHQKRDTMDGIHREGPGDPDDSGANGQLLQEYSPPGGPMSNLSTHTETMWPSPAVSSIMPTPRIFSPPSSAYKSIVSSYRSNETTRTDKAIYSSNIKIFEDFGNTNGSFKLFSGEVYTYSDHIYPTTTHCQLIGNAPYTSDSEIGLDSLKQMNTNMR
jgi:hypothetical protein